MTTYSLQANKNKKKYEILLSQSIKEFENFFGFSPMHTPTIIFLKSRKEFDDICGRKTESWVTGYNIQNIIYIMEESVYEKESSKKFIKELYPLTVKHELCHIFYHQLAWKTKPVWLNEGLAIFLSGQTKHRDVPIKFSEFLSFYEKNAIDNNTVYRESGFVVEKLISKFGRKKFLSLLKSIRPAPNNEGFLKVFNQVYGFELNYDNINNL